MKISRTQLKQLIKEEYERRVGKIKQFDIISKVSLPEKKEESKKASKKDKRKKK